MDWPALLLSLKLAFWTTLILLPVGLLIARILAWRRFAAKGLVEALIALPLVLPPTVLGYYLLTAFADASLPGRAFAALFGQPLAFSFQGLLLASIIFNLPFAIQPMQRTFEGVPTDVRQAAWCSGMSRWRTFWEVELPLGWFGVLTAAVLTFAHTLGEFGVVLMVGGNIPGETRTVAIAIYDHVQAFDDGKAGAMSALLLLFSFSAIAFVYLVSYRVSGRGRS
jgi:molybdate transport system permease protein